jgi:Flp pilus assembly protein TadG
MFALLGMVSLAVDWGRVQTAKAELQDATDAAARYAVAGLYNSTYLAKAQAAGAQNKVDGNAFAIAAADVSPGNWDLSSRTFTAGGSPTNAVRVIGRRNSTQNGSIPLYFGRIIGANSVDAQATSIARQCSLAAVGVDSLALTGNAIVQRKSGEGGDISVASNGTISISTNTAVYGDLLYRVTPTFNGTVTGRRSLLPSDMTFPAVTLPGGMSDQGTIYYTGGSNPVSGNVWCSGDVTFAGTASVTLYSDTYLYAGGNVSFSGSATVNTNGYRLYVYVYNSGKTVFFNATTNLATSIYAPSCNVTVNGPGTITGSVVGQNLTINTTLNYSGNSPIPFKSTGGGDLVAAGGVIQLK